MTPGPDSNQLSSRQEEVAALVATGLTNRAVAEELGISVDGIKYHVSEILGRLGLSTREGIRAALWTYRGSSALPLRSRTRGRAKEVEFARRMLDVARVGGNSGLSSVRRQ